MDKWDLVMPSEDYNSLRGKAVTNKNKCQNGNGNDVTNKNVLRAQKE